MNVFAFTVPMPPSTNNLFATYNGRRIPSRDYKAWRQMACLAIRAAWAAQGKPAFQPHMALTIHIGLNYKGDISNRIKAIEDSIGEAIESFPNDRYIDRVEIERVPGIDGARVLVMQLAPPDKRLGEARPIGEVIKPIMARAEAMAGLQSTLSLLPSAADRKRLIMAARECGAISQDDADMLIQAHMLETA